MNKIISLFILVSLSVSVRSQYKDIDSLSRLMEKEKNDSIKVQLMLEVAAEYFSVKPDSSLWYARRASELSKAINYKKGELAANSGLAELFTRVGNYPEALQMSLENVRAYKDMHDLENIFWTKRNLLWIYRDIGDTGKMVQTINELGSLADSLIPKNSTRMKFKLIVFHNLATTYDYKSEYDSAFKYERLVYDESMRNDDPEGIALSASTLADFYSKAGNIDSEFYYNKKAVVYAEEAHRFDIVRGVKYSLAALFAKKEQLDSAFFYGYESYNEHKQASDTTGVMDAAQLLSQLYSQKKRFDSAYKYLSEFTTLKEKTLNEEKIEKAQSINFNESFHQQQLQAERRQAQQQYKSRVRIYGLVSGLAIMLVLALILYRNNKQKQETNTVLKKQKDEIQSTLQELKLAQAQLIQSEKMASLGELTAGIAHEIQNPLNFVNNFSEINNELIEELKIKNEKLKIEDYETNELLSDIYQNNEKISMHGKRADEIVKGMLQHSRTSSGQKELTDINALADEYLRLAYHGLRAKDKSFNAKFETDFDNSIDKISIISQDIGRVILNLINNAFYAVSERQKADGLMHMVEPRAFNATPSTLHHNYEPTVTVTTKKANDRIEISVKDNGNGIPKNIVDKIFQPFFTTKPTGQGTGLGLSLAYDIIKAHGGEIKVETKEGEGSEFIIQLPL